LPKETIITPTSKMEPAKLQSEIGIKVWQIILFAVVFAITNAFASCLFEHWDDFKQGFRDGQHVFEKQ